MRPVSKTRAALNAQYAKLAALYKEQAERCAYCGFHQSPQNLDIDHIVSGTAGRAASLLHPDTRNVTCHDENPERAAKAATKVVGVLQTIERLQGRNFDWREELLIIQALVNRKPGFVRS